MHTTKAPEADIALTVCALQYRLGSEKKTSVDAPCFASTFTSLSTDPAYKM